jgi:hypothetical protein
MVSKLSEIRSGLFIPDPDPGSRDQKGTGSWIPDPQHCFPGCDIPILRGLPEERREVGRGSLEEKLLVHLQVRNNARHNEVEQRVHGRMNYKDTEPYMSAFL